MMKHQNTRQRSGSGSVHVYAALALGAILILSTGWTARNPGSTFIPAGDNPKWVAPASANGKKNPCPATDASIHAGKKIFVKECVSCHGKTGIGNGPKAADLEKPPGNLTTKDFQSQSDGAIFWKITKGKKPMPTFATAYTDEDRWNIVNYLRTFGK